VPLKLAHANITKINPLGNNCHIYWLDEVDSTNGEAQRRISAESEGSANLSVIAARSQTCGRGQGDHSWHSAPGENLTLSIILRYEDVITEKDAEVGSGVGVGECVEETLMRAVPAGEQHAVSALAALTVIDYLAKKGIVAHIKLENDIYIGSCVAEGRKICGILIKHHVRGARLTDSVIGLGININQKDFPADLPNPTSVVLELGASSNQMPKPLLDNEPKFSLDNELNVLLNCFSALHPLLFSASGRAELENRFHSLVIR